MGIGFALPRVRRRRDTRGVVDPSWAAFREITATAATSPRGANDPTRTAAAEMPAVQTPAADTPGARQTIGRLPGLDGLRAVAVIAVLLYHADLNVLPGGFLGVDVFFVISGYLITALLLAEWASSGSIRVRAFWLRRARRLLPAVFVLLAGTIVFAAAILPGELARLRADALAAFGYVTNWYLIVQHQSYFEAVGRPSLLRHLWSLAVEEQFYLVWPLVLVAGLAILRRRLLLVAIVAVAVLSSVWMAALYVPDADPSRVYYGTDTRLAPLLVGAALAFVWVPRERASAQPAALRLLRFGRSLVADGVVLGGLVGLAVLFLVLDDGQPLLYQGGFAVVALVTAAVIAAVVHPWSVAGRLLLDNRAIRWVGERSYSIYLWHWPVFVLTRPQLDVPLDALTDLLPRLALTILLADASYRFVETPVRRGAVGRLWAGFRERPRPRHRLRQRLAVGGLVGAMLVLTLGVAVEVVGASAPPVPAYLAVPSLQGDFGAAVPLSAAPSSAPSGAPGASSSASMAPASGLAGSAGPSLSPPAGSPEPSGPARSASPSHAPILAIGDSLMIGAAPQLARALGPIEVDALLGRAFQGGIGIVEARRAAGTLPPTVIIDLGNNGRFYPSDFDRMMRALRDVRTVVFVNLKVPRAWESPNNQELAAGVKKYANAVLVDWHAASENRPSLFWDDGIHLRPEGSRVYAALVAKAVEDAGAEAGP